MEQSNGRKIEKKQKRKKSNISFTLKMRIDRAQSKDGKINLRFYKYHIYLTMVELETSDFR